MDLGTASRLHARGGSSRLALDPAALHGLQRAPAALPRSPASCPLSWDHPALPLLPNWGTTLFFWGADDAHTGQSPWAGVRHSLWCPKTLPRTPKPCPTQHSSTAISAGALGAPFGEPTGLFSSRASPPGCCLPPPPRPLQKAGGNEAGA